MESTGPIRITLFGHPAVAAPLPGAVFPEKGFQLLAILCRAPRGECSRRKLASLLWDSQSDAIALANLRQLLARIRRALADTGAVLESKGQTIALGSLRSAIDLCAFQSDAEGSADARVEGSLRLYGGDLLETVEDATDAFLEWLTVERTALRQDFFCRAEIALTECTKFGRAPRDLLNDMAARMLALDPEREASYRVLIEAFGRNGMLDEAQRHLDALRKVLARDPNNAPAPETVAVVRRVFSVRHIAELPEPGAMRKPWQPRVMFLSPAWPHGAHNNRLMKVFIEDVANELARCRSFVVLAPHSTFQLEHESGHVQGSPTLRADYAISGFVKPDGAAGTLVLRMTDCESTQIVWSGQFKIGLMELLKSFDALVVRVASSLAGGLERNILSRRPHATDGAAYFQFLEGMQWLENCDLPRLRKARRCFKQAFSDDGAIASAAARIGQTLYLEWLQMGGADPNLLIDARGQAQLATDIDPNDPIGHWMEGTVALYQRDFDACEAKFAEAETLCPNSPDFLVQYADALSHLGDSDAGWAKFERAIDLNPAPPDRYWWAGASIAFNRHDYRKAIELCERLDSDESVLGLLCASFTYLGERGTARGYAKRIRENFPGGSALALGRIVPDRNAAQREHIIQGLRMAGVT
jgi:DNA-binding SARP family transcriptional activator/TolB-like protein/Tfp pilus assembly protein PilF